MLYRSFASVAAITARKFARLPRKGSLAVQCAYVSTSQSSSIIYNSPHENIAIPKLTIWDFVGTQLADHGDRHALICGLSHDKLTYEEMYNAAKRTAVALAQDGVRRGDVVLMNSINCMEFPIVMLALTSLGAVISPSSPMFNAQELASQAIAAKAKFIITHRALENVAIEVAETVGIDKSKLYTVGASNEPTKLKSIDEVSKREFDNTFKFEKIDPSDTLVLPFSSGTTGLPKGVALSGSNMLANALQVDHVETDLGDHMIGVLPFFHIYALLLIQLAMCKGLANVILPRFEPESFLDVLSTYKIKTAHVAPPIALFLAHHPLVDKYDLSATNTLLSGGAPMGVAVENLVAKRLNIQVRQAYGMTEASPAVNYTEPTCRKPGSVGRLLPNTELRIKCTVTDKDLPPHRNGELLYRGPQVMKGYLDNAAATAKTLMSDGFLRTGDIGYVDEEGFVYVVDRVKELIKYKGHQVAPAELEDVLNHHPEISDSCCVRGYDESSGEEIPKAFVVLTDPTNPTMLTEEEVMAFVADEVAPFKKIRQVEFIESIPKSLSGKLLRRQLQERENAAHDARRQ